MKTLERLNESKLTVVIPTFNEVENIPLILKKIEDTLKNVNFEIIFVDDNSSDGSIEKIRELELDFSSEEV